MGIFDVVYVLSFVLGIDEVLMMNLVGVVLFVCLFVLNLIGSYIGIYY